MPTRVPKADQAVCNLLLRHPWLKQLNLGRSEHVLLNSFGLYFPSRSLVKDSPFSWGNANAFVRTQVTGLGSVGPDLSLPCSCHLDLVVCVDGHGVVCYHCTNFIVMGVLVLNSYVYCTRFLF
jgi:hypothetical protein